MKNNFEEHEIAYAVYKSELSGLTWNSEDRAYEINDPEMRRKIHRFIEELPEPKEKFIGIYDQDDEWEECDYSEYQRGDQTKIETDKSISIAKYPVKRVRNDVAILEDGTELPYFPEFKYYRKPAPVVFPDPKIHQFIRDERDGDIMQATPEGNYVDVRGHIWPAHDFTNWTPMKVVEDDR